MEWHGEGTVIGRARHGEHGVILQVMTRDLGRLAGMVPGGASARKAAMLQPGARLVLRHRARLADQLGTFTPEPLRARASALSDGDALAGLNAVCALLVWALPERDPHPALHDRTELLLDAIEAGGDWHLPYLRWEMALLQDLGFGLDLGRCAVTGRRDGLAYVSPKTGRAVSAAAAGDWAPRLLPLPAVLGGAGNGGVSDGLRLTGVFLQARLAEGLVGRPIPAARDRLVARLARSGD